MVINPFRDDDFPPRLMITGSFGPVGGLEYQRETVGFYQPAPSIDELNASALVTEYYRRVDEFDLKHCSGRDRKGRPIPNTTPEYIASSKHAGQVRLEIENKAYAMHIPRRLLLDTFESERARRN